MIYLDHQGSTSMHPAAAAAVAGSALDMFANPHSAEHAAGWRAAEAIEAARAEVAAAVAADPDEVIFTSGATEANNLALLGLTEGHGPRNRIVVSSIEHKAVLGPARELARRGFELVVARTGHDGLIDLNHLRECVNDRTLLVSLMLVNNEIGTVQPVTEAARISHEFGALLHVDGAQALAWLPIDFEGIGADLMSLSAHKMGGPKGIGALAVRRDVRGMLRPITHGGEQEGGLRPGTLPTPLCIGFGTACRHLPERDEVEAWQARTAALEARLLQEIPGVMINGGATWRHPGCISATLPGIDADLLVARLQPAISISTGSACTSGIPEPSHVLRAIGLGAAAIEGTIRVSTGRFTSSGEIDEAATAIIATIGGLQLTPTSRFS